MTLLILGLVLFLGTHSIRIFAEPWRNAQFARLGEKRWKGLLSLVALAGLVAVIWGFGSARAEPVVLWTPPVAMRHIAGLLTLLAFVLVVAAYVPANHLKAALGHPMVAGVKTWAFAHLLANGRLADVVLFGAFLAWAVLDFMTARRRDRLAGVHYPAGTLAGDAKTVVIGVLAWAAFAFYLHSRLIGVRPFG